jgi:hypothetical protein
MNIQRLFFKNKNIGKYEFESKAVYDRKIELLHEIDNYGNMIPKIKFAAVILGHVVIKEGEYDDEGIELVAPLLSNKYHIDVIWFLDDQYNDDGSIADKDHPWGWKGRNNDIDTEGMHSFAGVSYLENKFKK